VKKFFQAATAAQSRKQKAREEPSSGNNKNEYDKNSSVAFARDLPKAGFLHKIRTNSQQYKRFFCSQTSNTSLT